jgi:hypothetical protein
MLVPNVITSIICYYNCKKGNLIKLNKILIILKCINLFFLENQWCYNEISDFQYNWIKISNFSVIIL